MEFSIILTTLLSTFTTWTPDLCDDVYLNSDGSAYMDSTGQTLSRYCEWSGPNVPIWDADVCCTIDDDGAHCVATQAYGRCGSGLKMYCEYGAAVPDGGVVCYQPFPSMCDAGLCLEAGDVLPTAQLAMLIACCNTGGACQYVSVDDVFECQGEILGCEYGMLNENGTVDCYD